MHTSEDFTTDEALEEVGHVQGLGITVTPPNDTQSADLKEFVKISKEILADFDEHEVVLKTPICYFKKFERLRELVKSIES